MKALSYQDLMKEFDVQVNEVSKAFTNYPWLDRRAYVSWLAQTYFYIRYTTRLVSLCAAKCRIEDQAFFEKTIWHLKEEVGHENIAIADLRNLGYAPDDIAELPSTRAIYHSQVFFVEHYGPYAQLGYSMLLEGMAGKAGPGVTKILTKTYGEKASKLLRVHAEEDPGHVEAGLVFLKDLDSTARYAITKNLTEGTAVYCNMLSSAAIAAKTLAEPRLKAAA